MFHTALELLLLCAVLFVSVSGVPSKSGVNLTESFQNVYDKAMWGQEGGKSGGGSTLKSTLSIRHFLYTFIIEHDIKSFLDAPCGAMVWQKAMLHHIQETHTIIYTGMDIVPSVIEDNKMAFSNEKTWSFQWVDISSTPIVNKYDMIMSRDVFFHLTFDKIMCALNNFKNSNSKYLIATSNPGASNAYDANSWQMRLNEGGFREVDLMAAPISLPKPAFLLEEKEASRIMGVWELANIPTFTHFNNVAINCGTVLSQ